jgi:hypothetical protein
MFKRLSEIDAWLAMWLLPTGGHLIFVDSMSDTRPRSESVRPSRQTGQKAVRKNVR